MKYHVSVIDYKIRNMKDMHNKVTLMKETITKINKSKSSYGAWTFLKYSTVMLNMQSSSSFTVSEGGKRVCFKYLELHQDLEVYTLPS